MKYSFNEAVAVLNDFCSSIKEHLFNKEVDVLVAPGFRMPTEQQYVILVKMGIISSDALIRVNVALDGYPVTVSNLSGGSPWKRSCGNKSELTDALKDLLKDLNFRLRLKGLRLLSEHYHAKILEKRL